MNLRREVIAWLRSFGTQVEAESTESLIDAILSEFSTDTAIFPNREAFRMELEHLHQLPKPDWSRRTQTWYPRHRLLDWYRDDDATTPQ